MGRSLRPLRRTETDEAARMLARAFRDNPLNRAVVRSEDAERCRRLNVHGMRALLPVAIERGRVQVAFREGAIVGALVSTPPFAYPLPAPPLVPRVRCLLAQGWGISVRWGQAFAALDAAHPAEPHWYLGTLGVDPSRQREGFGTALLRCWLEHVDSEREASYLETDTEENVQFYRRMGFEIAGDLDVFGARIWRMWRAARR